MSAIISKTQVLLVHPDTQNLNQLKNLLAGFCDVRIAQSAYQAIIILDSHKIDVVVSDLGLGPNKEDGLWLLNWISNHSPDAGMIFYTKDSCTERVDRAYKSTKAVLIAAGDETNTELLETIQKMKENIREVLKTRIQHFPTFSSKGAELVRLLEKWSAEKRTHTFCIVGEVGIGKRTIIEYYSRLSKKTLVTEDFSFMPVDQAWSLLSGIPLTEYQEPCTGLLERAKGGILFLRHIERYTPALLARLGHIIERKETPLIGGQLPKKVDAQIILSSYLPPKELLKRDIIGESLYYILKGDCHILPPLRERPEDIPFYFDYFLSQEAGGMDFQLTNEAKGALMAAKWSGNLLELSGLAAQLSLSSIVKNSSIQLCDLLENGFKPGTGRM